MLAPTFEEGLLGDLPRGDFPKLFSATALSTLGDGIRWSALPLLAASISPRPIVVSGLVSASVLPWLVLGLPSGALVDRWDRRKLMALADAVSLTVAVALVTSILLHVHTILLLYAAAFALGCSETVIDNAGPAAVPQTVPAERLDAANARMVAADIVAREFVGPPIGSLLFAVAMVLPFGVDAGTFAVAALLILSLRGRFVPQRDEQKRSSLAADIREGLRSVTTNRTLRTLSLTTLTWAVLDSAWFSILVLYVLQVLHIREGSFGLLLAVGGVGGTLGAALAPRLSRRLGRRRALVGSVALGGITQLVLGLASGVALAAVMLLLSSFAFAVWNVIGLSLRQEIVPGRLLGRATSVIRLSAVGGEAAGALLGGVMATTLGLRAPFLIGGPLLLGGALLANRGLRPASS